MTPGSAPNLRASPSELARKLLTTFELLPQQLSAQSHYAWGLRSVQAVLKAVGNAIAALGAIADSFSETKAAVRAAFEVISPRLTSEDLVRFRALLAADIFPGLDFPVTAEASTLASSSDSDKPWVKLCLRLPWYVAKHLRLEGAVSGALSKVLENPRETFISHLIVRRLIMSALYT